MNKRLLKCREKFRKNTEKVTELTEENKKLAPIIRELEDKEIIGIVRGHGMTPDDLEEMFGPVMDENEKLKAAAEKAENPDGNEEDTTAADMNTDENSEQGETA